MIRSYCPQLPVFRDDHKKKHSSHSNSQACEFFFLSFSIVTFDKTEENKFMQNKRGKYLHGAKKELDRYSVRLHQAICPNLTPLDNAAAKNAIVERGKKRKIARKKYNKKSVNTNSSCQIKITFITANISCNIVPGT